MSKRLLKDLSRSLSLPDSSNATNYQDPIDMLNRYKLYCLIGLNIFLENLNRNKSTSIHH